MQFQELVREIREFLEARRNGTLTLTDYFELAHQITAFLVSLNGPQVFGDAPPSDDDVELLLDATDELAGAVGSSDSAVGCPVVDALVAAAIKALIDYIQKRRA